VKIIYLSPYSPDFNPIEEMFSSFKAYIRRHGDRLRGLLRTKDKGRISMFFYEAIGAVCRPAKVAGWFRNYRRPA